MSGPFKRTTINSNLQQLFAKFFMIKNQPPDKSKPSNQQSQVTGKVENVSRIPKHVKPSQAGSISNSERHRACKIAETSFTSHQQPSSFSTNQANLPRCLELNNVLKSPAYNQPINLESQSSQPASHKPVVNLPGTKLVGVASSATAGSTDITDCVTTMMTTRCDNNVINAQSNNSNQSSASRNHKYMININKSPINELPNGSSATFISHRHPLDKSVTISTTLSHDSGINGSTGSRDLGMSRPSYVSETDTTSAFGQRIGGVSAWFKYYLVPQAPISSRVLLLFQSYSALISLLCVILCVVIYKSREGIHLKEICISTDCVLSASEIVKDIDQRIDPCSDFYSFACNGYIARHPIPDGVPAVGPFPEAQNAINERLRDIFDSEQYSPGGSGAAERVDEMNWFDTTRRNELFNKMKRFYYSCVDKNGKSAAHNDSDLKRYLNELGGWPPISPANVSFESFDLTDSIIKLYQIGFLYEFFVGFEVDPDHYDNSQYILQVTQGLRSTSARTLKAPFNSTESQSFLAYMVRVAVKLGGDEATARNDLIQAYQLDRQLSRLELPLGRIAKSYNVMSIDDLYQLAPIIDWARLIHTLTSDRLVGKPQVTGPINGRFVKNSTKIIVHHPNFISLASRILSTAPRRILATYVGWYATLQGVQWMGSEWRTLRHRSSGTNCPDTSGESGQGTNSLVGSRWRSCTNQMQRWLGLGVAHFYLKKHVPPDSSKEISEIISYLKAELIKTLHQASWMDETTKANAIWKAENVIAIAGHSAELLNTSLMSEYYEDIDFSEDNYFENRLSLQRWSREKNFALLGTVGARSDWKQESKTLAVNAYHTWNQNKLAISAGLMQGVFYGYGRQKYLNYGAVGALAAHEFIHGFDIVGRRYSSHGNLENWWNMNTTKAFYQKAECFLNQYNRQQFHGHLIDGSFTLAENIADNGGINLAYKAYRKYVEDHYDSNIMSSLTFEPKLPGLDYTGNQLFWISFARVWCLNARTDHLNVSLFADPHSPNPIRTNVALSNSPDFAQDWNCPAGSPMNPVDKCSLW